MIDPYTMGKNEIGFSWVDNTGRYRCWLTDRMIVHAKRTSMEIVQVDMDMDYAKFVRRRCGIEKHRLDRITPQIIAQNPVIYIDMGDGSSKLVDGNHRYVKAAMLGWQGVPAHYFDAALASEFELDIPPHLNDQLISAIPTYSGIA